MRRRNGFVRFLKTQMKSMSAEETANMLGLAEAISDQLKKLNVLANGANGDSIEWVSSLRSPSTEALHKGVTYDADVVATISGYRQELDMITSALDCAIRENVLLKESLGNLQNEIETMSSGMGSQMPENGSSNVMYKREIANLTENLAVVETTLLASNSHNSELQNHILILEELKQSTQLEGVINVAKMQEMHIDQMKKDDSDIKLLMEEISANLIEMSNANKQTIKMKDLMQKLKSRVTSRIDTPSFISYDTSRVPMSVNNTYDVHSNNQGPATAAVIPWCCKPSLDQCQSGDQMFRRNGRDETDCQEVRRSAPMTATVGAHINAIKNRMVLLEETRRIDEAALESLKAKNANVEYQSGKSPLKGSLPIGTFAYFRRGDVASLRLQVEHLRLQLHKKDTELENVKLEKVTSSVRTLKVCRISPTHPDDISTLPLNHIMKLYNFNRQGVPVHTRGRDECCCQGELQTTRTSRSRRFTLVSELGITVEYVRNSLAENALKFCDDSEPLTAWDVILTAFFVRAIL